MASTVSGELRASTRFVWSKASQLLKPGQRAVRFTEPLRLMVRDISKGGLRVRRFAHKKPPSAVTVDMRVPKGSVALTVNIGQVVERERDWILVVTTAADREALGRVVEAIIESGCMVPMPRRRQVLPPSPSETPCDLASATCPDHNAECPMRVCSPVVMKRGVCAGGHGPIPYANVIQACHPEERGALNALLDIKVGEVPPTRLKKARDILAQTSAVIACHPVTALNVMVQKGSIQNVYTNRETRFTAPPGDRWQNRDICDTHLFPGYKEKIRFAALSLDGRGIASFGACFLKLKDSFLSRTASVFDENSHLAIETLRNDATESALRGRRASWQHRVDLVLSKLGPRLRMRTLSVPAWERILVINGDTPEDDQFVEVHIYGTVECGEIEYVSLEGRSYYYKAISLACESQGVPFVTR